jgi:hypothetical protein
LICSAATLTYLTLPSLLVVALFELQEIILKVERSYEIANVSLTLEKFEFNYFVIVKRGGKPIINVYYGDQRGAENQFNLLETLIPALIRG